MFSRALTSIAVTLVFAQPALAGDPALVKLLEILLDRGSITREEYEAIRSLSDSQLNSNALLASTRAVATVAAPRRTGVAGTSNPRDQEVATRADEPRPQSGAWYQRFALRGYTQFRFARASVGAGQDLDVPADRSVNAAESFIIRRGRFVLSGDPAERLSVYAQSDLVASTGAVDFAVQLRDLYGDIWLNRAKTARLRLGQSKVPFGWSNLQSSQNRAPLERADALNSAAEGERDLGAYFLWESGTAKRRFQELVNSGLKGSGDYGVVAVGAYAGQGPNRADVNGETHLVGRLTYPFQVAPGQFVELGVQGYSGRFVTATQGISVNGSEMVPARAPKGERDRRLALSAIWYPSPVGIEAEWTVGRGPQLSEDYLRIDSQALSGGYVQLNVRAPRPPVTWFPFARWHQYDGGRKFARNAPHERVNEMDMGLEVAAWAGLEATVMYTHTFERTRTSTFPYSSARDGNRVGFQMQWSY